MAESPRETQSQGFLALVFLLGVFGILVLSLANICLLYTSDAADERSSVDLGGRRLIQKQRTSEH